MCNISHRFLEGTVPRRRSNWNDIDRHSPKRVKEGHHLIRKFARLPLVQLLRWHGFRRQQPEINEGPTRPMLEDLSGHRLKVLTQSLLRLLLDEIPPNRRNFHQRKRSFFDIRV